MGYVNEVKKSGQIPAFGNWDYANELPITQYFDCARQAGLFRPSSSSSSAASSSCQCGPCVKAAYADAAVAGGRDNSRKPRIRVVVVPPRKGNKVSNNSRRPPQDKEQKKAVRRTNELKKEQPTNQFLSMKQHLSNHKTPSPPEQILLQRPTPPQLINVKPVDQDLYKIPSDLLHNSNRKKMLGFFSRCLVPPCRA